MKSYFTILLLFMGVHFAKSQTDVDGIMMSKNNLCAGPILGFGSWKNYWEGTLLRNNENLGTVSTRSLTVMGNYGITDHINVIFMLPWIKNAASAGTLHSMQGIQDVSLFGKFRLYTKELKNNTTFTSFGLIGASIPVTQYVTDYLPLSIGMGSANAIGRLSFDIIKKNVFATVSYAHVVRSDVKIDRNSYYTTEMHLTNLVDMPAMGNINFRTGYRKGELILEAVVDNMSTYGGFDIRLNDMPFLSNNMEAFRAGVNVKIPIPKVNGLSFTGNSMLTLAGRNMGKSLMNNVGFYYLMDLSKKEAAK